jgi:hypothetical protein
MNSLFHATLVPDRLQNLYIYQSNLHEKRVIDYLSLMLTHTLYLE